MNNIKYFLVVQLIFSFCLCEISNGLKEKLLNGFKEYYNSLPNQVYRSEEGSLLSTQQVDDTTYQIVASIRVAEINNVEATKLLKCTATVKDSDNDVTIINNNCEDAVEQKQSTDENQETTLEAQVEVSEPTVERRPVQLVNEVQADTAITSGEQFIAIPRDQPNAPCVGCASHVNPQAAGVSDLANLGVRHLDLHEPSVKHSLESVLDVERQVQVVNGVRYVLTLSINFNHCTEVESENCASSKTCKITILVKPWVKLSNGENYRAILANNCTEEWLYGDNGEVLPDLSADNNQIKGNTSVDPSDTNAFDGDIQVKHSTNVESQPNQERSLTEDDIKKIQEQIISNTQFQEITESSRQSFTLSPDASDASKQHVFKVESVNNNENSIPVTESEKTEQASIINLDKKKAIDEMLDFFDFSGFKPKSEVEDVVPRVRRSYDYDLQVLSLAKDFHGIKNSIENARFMYEMAEAMVDYLNEMDLDVKNRAVKNVIRAEEETENLRRFVYIQARITIPCDKVECEPREVNTQICNGVIDCTNEKSPQVLNTFCYNDNKESENRQGIREISLDDPVLLRMVEEAVKKIESDSKSQYAMKINKIASAITQVTSGTLTKFSVIVENIKCNKSVPLPLRMNCTVLEQLGSQICDVIVHERHWLKEQKISYTCTERPADMRISKSKKVSKNLTVDDPEIIEMLQEAIQYLESQSDKTNKQKIINVQSISSQIIAGFLTKIEFVVGYTDCTDENYSRDQINKCELLKGEGLRSCRAQIWDRSWIMDGRQIEVSCDDASKTNEIVNTRKKRSIDYVSDREQLSSSKDNDINYKKLANESLYKFMQSSSSHQHYEVVKVDKATVQDISRKLIKIDFSISPTDCLIQNDGILSLPKCEIVNPKNILHCHSKILENNWIAKKQYFVKCNIKYQQKKNVVKERNPSDSKYNQLAEESLAKYLHDTGNPHHIIVRVEKVTTQIVSGLLTKIDFIISPKNQSGSYSKTVRCHSEILEKRWLETKAFNVSCQMKKKEHLVKINADDPKYMQIAVESLQKYINDKTESRLVRVAFVDKVEQKGNIIKIGFIASHADEGDGDTFCNAEVSETRESKSDIEVKCHLIGKIYRKAEITEDDSNYQKYVQLADECLRYYLQKMNSSLYTLVSIESVTVQWDEGIKTFINFTISAIDSEPSELIQGKKCIAEILEQLWLHKKNIDVKCELEKDLYRTKRRASNAGGRRQLNLGGVNERDPSNAEYKALAEESLRKYVVDSGITQPLQVARIQKVTTQVVSGKLTQIDFLVSGSPDSETMKCHTKVWDQPWLNSKEINVSCQNDSHLRGKRHLFGGPKEQDPTELRYKALAEESLRKYAIDSGITEPLEVAHVEKVTTQVVSGTVIRIDFLVSGSPGSESIKCHSEVWDRPWLKGKDKSITVSCEKDGHRGKRQVPGGSIDQDPTKPKYKALAEESLRKYCIDSGISQPLEVARVERVTTSVVAGSLTSIDFLVSSSPDSKTIKCHSEVWQQGWRNFKEINVSCQKDSHLRGKRHLFGGPKEQDPTEPRYKALAEESLRKYAIDSGITEALEVAHVEKVTTQVVSGTVIRIDFLVSGSPDSESIKCHSEVWDRPWLKGKDKSITVSCEKDGHRGKRQVPGGSIDQDPTKPQYKALAEESLRKYCIDSGISQPLEVARVERVTTAVVAGSLTSIDFLVSSSPDSKTIKCHSEVWQQGWRNFKEIKVSCDDDGHRDSRQLVGGLTDQDPTDPKYHALAGQSLRKYMKEFGITQPLEVMRVEKVSTQLVAGLLTRIDFVVSDNRDSVTIICHSKIFEQVWLNHKEIDVSCPGDGYRRMDGGFIDQDPAEPQYKMLAEDSLRKYVSDSGITQPLEVASVKRVITQVVSGMPVKTGIDFTVSSSHDSNTIICHSDIWEQPWLSSKNIEVSCQNNGHRSKRGLFGGISEVDPTAPQYKALAEECLRKYVIDFGIAQPLEVVQVEKVTTQTVSGSMTRIDFLVSGSPDTKIIKCHSEVWEQSWLNSKKIDISCQNDSHLRGTTGLFGGISEVDPTAPQYKALAEECLRKYVIDFGIAQSLEVVQVEKVTTQTVSGSMTRIDFLVSGSPDTKIIKCHSEVWEQSWLNSKKIDISCQNDSHLRGKRGLPGGISEVDPTAPQYKALAEECLRKYVIDFGIAQPLEVVQVEKVTTQTVSGSMTRIDFLVSGSPDTKIIKCHSEVWEQSWLNSKKIDISCQNDSHLRGTTGLFGGISEVDPTAPQYKALAEECLRKYVIDFGIAQPLEVVQVEKVTTQTVSGSMTRIDFLVSGSPDTKIIKCHSEVWEQSWLNSKKIDISCQNDSHLRGKRGLPGGISEVDPTAPQYKALAEECLRKYVIDFGIAQPLEVVQVEKVTTQTVSGSMTRIDFLVSGRPDTKIIKCHSEVWEQSWLNSKKIDISCQNDSHLRGKRGLPGGISEVDPTAPQYKALAEECLRKYMIDFGIAQPLEVVQVEKVTTQTVSGSMTRIDFLVSGSPDTKIIKCHSEVWEQSWLNSKKIDISCQNDSHLRGKRGLFGGISEVDPTAPQYKALAEECLRKYVIDFGIAQPLEVVQVEKVTTQTVSGSMTRIDFLVSGSPDTKIIKCHSEVWEQSWLNSKKIDISCQNDSHLRGKRGLPGGISEVDPTAPQYKALAEECLRKYVIDFGIAQPLEVVQVEKVTTQTVSGSMTRIDFLVSGSPDTKIIKCHSEVWEQSWLNSKKIDISCQNDSHLRGKRGLPGGISEVDPTAPQYKALAEECLRKYVIDFGIAQPLEVVQVEKVTTQTVSGSMTRIDFLVSGSPDTKIIKCHSEVWEQSWLNSKKIDISCQNDSHLRGKRGLFGGISEVDPTAPQYKALAEECLRKYVIDFGIAQPLEVVQVEKVTTQTVSGSMTRIDFLVSGSPDTKTIKCHSEIWDRPWLKEKVINVSCFGINERVKRDLRLSGGASENNLITSRYKVLTKESNRENSSIKGQQHVGILRGHGEEEQDPNKHEYKVLAEESLRKLYQKKSTVYHKVVEVHRVVTRVVSGLKYKIDFTAAPTACSVNVSSTRARSCKADDDVLLYCHSDIWDQPWLKKKKIDVQCNGPTYDKDDFENETDNDLSLKPSDHEKNNVEKYIKLAEEASEKYLTTSNRKYVHKVTEILSASEQDADGIFTNIDYSLSPTTCLRNETTNNTSCKLKQPLVVFNCNANIRTRQLHVEKEIKVTCKKNSKTNVKKRKRESGVRNIRQIDDDDDELDEDTTYYYADRAVQHLNDNSMSNNLHKLISIHAVQSSVQMGTLTVKMYIEVAETYCLRHHKAKDLRNCEEMGGSNHRLCLARVWPSPDDELIVRHVSVVCDDDENFVSVTGVNIPELIRLSVAYLESPPENKFKLVHQGEPQVIPSLDSRRPFKLNFIISITNCSKDVNLGKNPFQCYLNPNIPKKKCHAYIWLRAEAKYISNIDAQCTPVAVGRFKRSALDPENVILQNSEIQKMVTESLQQLEMQSQHRYKQRVLQINSHSTKISSGKVTTIDFDVGYTSCLKYEWVANITSCNFLDHLPRRRCVAQIRERLWISNGKHIDINCVDDETPLESHIEFESAEMANELAKQALKHIEAKYPHPSKQKVVRIFSLEKQVVAGIHYKMKVEVGSTDCIALSDQKDCKLAKNYGENKFCRVNVWIRPWTDHPPNFRVSCDFQEGTTRDLYHHVQAEHLFYNFLTTYSPSYVNNYSQMHKRFEIFKNNVKKIHELNVHEKGTAVYGVTRFTDLSYEEFSSTYMGLKTNLSNENQVPMKQADIPNVKVPPNFDWREFDAVTDVKDQGSCGSCWAFSVTGNIEGQWKMQSGQLVSLSEQELVDCDKLDEGCNGGLPDNAYRAIEQMGGLELESDYPYEGTDDKCLFNKTLAKVQISSAVNITTNETGMAQWLVHNGPISIGINANAMQFYMGGISHPWKMLCNPTNLDHGVLIVGYGVKDYPLFHKELPYWIIKNSWGKSWGEQGYYRVYRGDGTCGVNKMASSAVI